MRGSEKIMPGNPHVREIMPGSCGEHALFGTGLSQFKAGHWLDKVPKDEAAVTFRMFPHQPGHGCRGAAGPRPSCQAPEDSATLILIKGPIARARGDCHQREP